MYRGYLMNQVADLLNRTRGAWIVSLIAVHVAFGLAHAYQGIAGVLDEFICGRGETWRCRSPLMEFAIRLMLC